ncbi:hypothetical protein AURDEDRAFT_171989 [Auricularia subglabra TFB-10046 SS5]|nr:hypothetical protein AURDEDRAFT_171989 [Auricularia subglabra TFB-10046 SS5]
MSSTLGTDQSKRRTAYVEEVEDQEADVTAGQPQSASGARSAGHPASLPRTTTRPSDQVATPRDPVAQPTHARAAQGAPSPWNRTAERLAALFATPQATRTSTQEPVPRRVHQVEPAKTRRQRGRALGRRPPTQDDLPVPLNRGRRTCLERCRLQLPIQEGWRALELRRSRLRPARSTLSGRLRLHSPRILRGPHNPRSLRLARTPFRIRRY